MKKFLRNQEHLETSGTHPITVHSKNLIILWVQCPDFPSGNGMLPYYQFKLFRCN